MKRDEAAPDHLRRARDLASGGDDEAAKQEYLALLRLDPAHVDALIELAVLAEASGHRSAALSAYREATRLAPDDRVARTGLAHLLRESGDLALARLHYEAALAADPLFAPAHQGLAQILAATDDPATEHHLRAGFAGAPVARQRYRGPGAGIPLVKLVSGRGGNVPTSAWIDNRRYAVTAVCAEFHDPAVALPPHALVVNAIGDAELCGEALSNAERLVEGLSAPIINHPSRVRETSRENNARRLAPIAGVIAPSIMVLGRHELGAAHSLGFPLLLRSRGFHTGQNFVRVQTAAALEASASTLPGDKLLAIQCLDARGADGLSRKYRVMFIDGVLYPLHLAASTDWKVHYFTAAMADRPDLREEERAFLYDVAGVLGERAMAALSAIRDVLGLDYCGIDFGLSPDGSLLLFETNATMVINPPGPETIWDYRRPVIDAAIDAACRMIDGRVSRQSQIGPPA